VNNITSAFRKCGLYPFNDDVVPDHQIAPATSFSQEARPIFSKPTAAAKSAESFLVEKGGQLLKNVETAKKSRNTLSKVIAEKPITEDDVVKKIKEHKENQTSKQKPSKSKSSKNVLQKQKTKSPTPGTSGIPMKRAKKTNIRERIDEYENESSDDEIPEKDKCLVCKKFSPDTSKRPFIIIVKWGQCDKCNGWVHLAFCTPVRVLRKGDRFLCPNCDSLTTQNEQ
jgi:hypothetical protein